MRRRLYAFILVLAALAAVRPAGPARAGDWPQFKRDAARTGDAPDEALALPMTRVTALRLPAPIYASPAIVDGKVYVQDARGNVVCAAAGTNKVLWAANIGGLSNRSSPAVANGRVYLGSDAGHLSILDAASGKLVAKVEAGSPVIAAPAVANGHVYFSTLDGTLRKIDADGKVVWSWTAKFGGSIRFGTSITEFAVRGQKILFIAGAGYHLADEGKAVRLLGDSKRMRFGTRASGGVCYGADDSIALQGFLHEWGRRVIVNLGDGRGMLDKDLLDARLTPSYRAGRYYWDAVCFDATPDGGSGRPTPIWQANEKIHYPGSTHSSPALAAKHLVIGSEMGRVFFLPLEGPDRVRNPAWDFKTAGAGGPNGAVSSSPAIADGRVYFGGEDGILYGLGAGAEAAVADALGADAYRPRELPGAKLSGTEWPTVGGDMGFSCVSPADDIKPPFRLKWRTRVWSTSKGPMIVAEGKVFRAARLGEVEALDAETGEVIWRAHHGEAEARPAPTYADGKLLVMRPANSGRSSSRGLKWHAQPGGGIWCHDAKTGKLLWRREVPLGYPFNADGLAVHDGKVLAAWHGGDGRIEAAAFALTDGKEAWRRTYEGLIAKDRDDLFRFSAVCGDGRFYLSVPSYRQGRGRNAPLSNGATLAIKPDTGEVIWSNTEHTIVGRTRIAFRTGTLVVFGVKGGQALDPATGKLLWIGEGYSKASGGSTSYYAQPLTDLYLQSKGQRGVAESMYCSYAVFANGYWYGHLGKDLVAARLSESDGKSPKDVNDVVWNIEFTSAACPTPSPAYGRLYYSANAEGVVYCFEPAEEGKE